MPPRRDDPWPEPPSHHSRRRAQRLWNTSDKPNYRRPGAVQCPLTLHAVSLRRPPGPLELDVQAVARFEPLAACPYHAR